MYSVVHDWASKLPQDIWTRPLYDEYAEIIRRLKAIDDKIGNPDCNPNKGEFMETIKKRLDELERRTGITPSGPAGR